MTDLHLVHVILDFVPVFVLHLRGLPAEGDSGVGDELVALALLFTLHLEGVR